jgi:hypothetical protein
MTHFTVLLDLAILKKMCCYFAWAVNEVRIVECVWINHPKVVTVNFSPC